MLEMILLVNTHVLSQARPFCKNFTFILLFLHPRVSSKIQTVLQVLLKSSYLVFVCRYLSVVLLTQVLPQKCLLRILKYLGQCLGHLVLRTVNNNPGNGIDSCSMKRSEGVKTSQKWTVDGTELCRCRASEIY